MTGQLERIVQLNNLSKKQHNSFCRNLVSVFSGKGGTGKTFVSLNLAYALFKKKKKILLIDFDTNFSNIHLMINKKTERTLFDYFTNKNTLEEIIVHNAEFPDIIFGESGRSNFPKLTESTLNFFRSDLEKLSPYYDLLIIDLGSGASDEVLYLASYSGIRLLVSNPEPTAVIDAYVMLKLLQNQNDKTEVHLLMNKCISDEEGLSAYSKLKIAVDHFLQIKISLAGLLLNDNDVHRSINDQKLYLQTSTDNKLSRSFNQLSIELMKYDQLININQSSDPRFQSAF